MNPSEVLTWHLPHAWVQCPSAVCSSSLPLIGGAPPSCQQPFVRASTKEARCTTAIAYMVSGLPGAMLL
eukprot:6933294-Heterocapsa_arctica.AAC.1